MFIETHLLIQLGLMYFVVLAGLKALPKQQNTFRVWDNCLSPSRLDFCESLCDDRLYSLNYGNLIGILWFNGKQGLKNQESALTNDEYRSN
jgi:hypothetical protein